MNRKEGKDFSNQKFNKVDFSGQDLMYANFRGASLIECNFTKANLTYANFTGANCYGSDFTDSTCYRTNFMDCPLEETIFKPREAFGITVTLKCETFRGMEVDGIWFLCWLFMPTLMKLPNSKNGEQAWRDKIILLFGPERFNKFKAVFDRRVI